MYERASARIDLGAIAHNCGVLRRAIGPETELCPVLKAGAYGHGVFECAPAAIAAGADRIAVATAREAVAVREIDREVQILVLGALAPEESALAIEAGGAISVWDPDFAEALDSRAAVAGRRVRVHVKYDTGMGRLGSFDPEFVLETVRRVDAAESLELEALWTHFATADEADRSYMESQLGKLRGLGEKVTGRVSRYEASCGQQRRDPGRAGEPPRPGAARGGALRHGPFRQGPGRTRSEAGTLAPLLRGHGQEVRARNERRLRPDLDRSQSDHSRHRAGRLRRRRAPWSLQRGEVLIGGRRHPISGTVSMDNITVAVGDAEVSVGDEVTLIGEQGGQRITAEQVAARLGTINYEVTCGVSPRVPRRGAGAGA